MPEFRAPCNKSANHGWWCVSDILFYCYFRFSLRVSSFSLVLNWLLQSCWRNNIETSVASAVGPSVITSSTDSSFQNLVFLNLFELSASEITLKSISPAFWIQTLPNKSQDLSNNNKGTFQCLQDFQLRLNLIKFQWRNHSIFKNFCTASPNAMKPSRFTSPPWLIFSEEIIQYSRTFALQVQTSWNQADAPLLLESFPKKPRTQSKASRFAVDLIGKKQNKTNYLASWIDYQNREENKVDRVRRRGEGYWGGKWRDC